MSAWVTWVFWTALGLNLASVALNMWGFRRMRQLWIELGEMQERERWLQLVQGGGIARFSVGPGREVEIRAQSQRLSPDEPLPTKH